jgi:aspartyl-tRNA(Asn)/glutamyl-tRNA(Gln) amidotransferase subunit A
MAAALAALQQAGASQWASLVMAPHACGATAQNAHFARCVNPLDASAAVGGSSSGSAVAVAAGMSYAALGTDTAGSVRIPAATCGLIGLKTTHGAISTQGCTPLAPSLDSVGILSRYAQDAREIWSALCPQLPRPDQPTITRCKLWVPEDGVAPEVAQAIRAWAAQLDAQITPADLAVEFDRLNRHAQRVLLWETASTHHASLCDGTAEPSVQAIGLMGLGLPQAWYQASMRSRAALLQDFVARHFSDAEFLILPSLADHVPDWQTVEVGHAAFDRASLFAMHRYMGFVNYLGLPSLNLPIARDSGGRPVCVQVLARPFAEHRLLDLAEQVPPIFWTH